MDDLTTQPEEAVVEAGQQPAPEPVPQPDDQQQPINPDEEAPEEGAEGEGGEGDAPPEIEPIAAPTSWAKDAKDVFGTLPREAQEVIAAREKERETFLQSKSREAANTRQTVEREAHGVIQQLMQNHVAQLEQYAQQFNAVPPDMRLLQSDDPQHQALYWQQERAYRLATAQRESISQQIDNARQANDYASLQQEQMALAHEASELAHELPEWSDPSERAKLEERVKPIAAELGYPQELFSEARPRDLLALKRAAVAFEKAAKWDALNKRRMEPVRAARQIAPTARASAPGGQQAPVSTEAQMYPDDVRRN